MKTNPMMTEAAVPVKRHRAFKPKNKEHIEKVKEFKAFYGKQMISIRDRFIKLQNDYRAMRKALIVNRNVINGDLSSRIKEFLDSFEENLTSIKETRDELNEVYKELTMIFNMYPRMITTDLEGRHEIEEIIDGILFDLEDCEENWSREADLFYYEIEKQTQKYQAKNESTSKETEQPKLTDDSADNTK